MFLDTNLKQFNIDILLNKTRIFLVVPLSALVDVRERQSGLD